METEKNTCNTIMYYSNIKRDVSCDNCKHQVCYKLNSLDIDHFNAENSIDNGPEVK